MCYLYHLTQLDLSNNSQLKNLDCTNNQLTELDLSDNTALQYVDCTNNPLETIYVFEGYSFSLDKPETTQVVIK